MTLFKKSIFVQASVVMVGIAMAVMSLVSIQDASALTSGIVESSLVLNLDANASASYSGSGTTLTDLSSANRTVSLAGSPLPTFDSTSPKSFQFTRTAVNNTTSTANKILVAGKFLTDDFTIQSWIQTNQVGNSSRHYQTMYIMAAECGGGADDWGMGVNNSGKLAFGAGRSDTTFSTPESVNTNNWINVAATRIKATGEIKLYINGELKTTGIGNIGNSLTCSADNNTWIGNGQDGAAFSFGGKISSVLAYTKALSASEILTNYDATSDTFYPVTYTVSYDANEATSGSVPLNGSYTTGVAGSAVATNSGQLARSGYTFAGWNTAADGNGTLYSAGVSTYSTKANVTLYAAWTLIPTTTTTSTTTTTTTTTVPPAVVVIDIQAPVSTIAIGQASVATISPQGSGAPTTTLVKAIPPASAVTSTTGPVLKTDPVTPPVIPKVSTGETALDVGGVSTKVDVTRENNQLVVKSGSLQAVLSGRDSSGATRALDSDGNLRLNGGDVVKINMGGFKPGSEVDVWLFSTPIGLGRAVVGVDGRMSGAFTIPRNIEDGPHRIAITAKLSNGKSATFALGIALGEIAKTSTLTRVLIAIPIVMAIAFALILPNQLRRRRKISMA